MLQKFLDLLENTLTAFELKKSDRTAILILSAILIIGQVVLFVRYQYNPFTRYDVYVESFDRSDRPTIESILETIEIQTASKEKIQASETEQVKRDSLPRVEINPGSSLININTASLIELQKLTRVGPKTAQRIVDYRSENGNFQRIEDIQKVKGIGPKTFEKMKDQITVK